MNQSEFESQLEPHRYNLYSETDLLCKLWEAEHIQTKHINNHCFFVSCIEYVIEYVYQKCKQSMLEVDVPL